MKEINFGVNNKDTHWIQVLVMKTAAIDVGRKFDSEREGKKEHKGTNCKKPVEEWSDTLKERIGKKKTSYKILATKPRGRFN